MNPDQATFRRSDRDGFRTLTVTGEIDLVTAPRFSAELESVISEAHSPAGVDLSAVTFFDSSALHALIRAQEHVAGTKVRLVLISPSKACGQVLDVTDTAQLFEIVTRNDDVEN